MNKQYGEFSRKGDEFIVHRIDTPKPWVLTLTNGMVQSTVSQFGSGELVDLQSGSAEPVTRPVTDSLLPHVPSRRLILRDNDSGKIWNLTGGADETKPDHFEATFSPTHARIENSTHEIDSAVTIFLPPEDACEIWRVTIRNNGATKRRISLFAAVEWHTARGHEFETTFSDNTLISQSRSGESDRRCSFFACDHVTDSFDTREAAFLGRNGTYAQPVAVSDGRCSRSLGASPRPIGVLQKNLTLGGGAETELAFILGAVWGSGKSSAQISSTAHSQIKRIVHKFKENQVIDSTLTLLKSTTDEMISRNLVKSPDPFFDAMTNYWSKQEAQTTVLTATAPTKLALSSLATVAASRPDIAKKKLIKFFAQQSHDGRLVESGTNAEISQWLVAATTAYLRETGDMTILDQHVEYDDASSATVLHHIIRSLDFAASHLSSRHLPISLITAAVKEESQVEDQVLACQVYQNYREILPILDAVGEHELVRRYDRMAAQLKEAINDHFWDGSWYGNQLVNGKKFAGFKKNEAHSVNLSSQTSAIIAGVPSAERAKKLVTTFRNQLLTKYGLVSFTSSYPHPTSDDRSIDAPGCGKNGSISAEENAQAVIAAAQVGDGDEAFRLWQLASPAYLSGKTEQYQSEPFRHCDFIYGPDHQLFGQGATGPSGAAARMWQAAFQAMVGIQPTLGGLKIDPCLPRDWRQVEATRLFRGAQYHIRILNSFRQNKGVDRILVDGVRITGTVIPPYATGVHFVEVVIG